MKNHSKNALLAVLICLCGLVSSGWSAISITVAAPSSASGQILGSNGLIVTSGFARVGKLTGSIDTTKTAPTFANYQYWDSIFMDVNDPTSGTGITRGGAGTTPGGWNFNVTTGGLSQSSTGIAADLFPQNTQLYIWAFKVSGKSLTTNSTAGSSTVTIPVLDANDFTAGVEWALLTADEWKAPADLGTLSLTISQITATDVIQSPIIGSDLGNSVTMIPEPSSMALLSLGIASLFGSRRRKQLNGQKI